MKKRNFVILTSLATILMAPVAYGVLPKSVTQPITNLLISQALNPEQIQQKAKAISVKITSNNMAGSGVIIGKEGNTYTVLTNAHVVNNNLPHEVVTFDGEIHQGTVIYEGNSLEGNDLSVLTFNTSKNYEVANLAINPELKPNQPVYSAGFPEAMDQFSFAQGTIQLEAPKPFLGGYKIGYDIDVQPGMSGGALLNNKGELIGVNGLLKRPVLNEAYNYLDGSQPFSEQIKTYRQLSFAVPIQTLIEVAPNLAFIPNEWKTGLNLAAKVDNIAQQITVRIDGKNGVEGSGGIVGKEGDTYYVLTACHVVSDPYCQSGKVKDNYQLITADGQRYPMDANSVILPQGLDAAIIKFKSKKAYQVATIGNYKIPLNRSQLVFVSGFPGELNGVRKFTAGYRFHRDRGLTLAFDTVKLDVDTSGYELLYTNLTKPGMSGGPILDINGHIIGINTGQEGEIISSTEVRQLGYAFGVPASSLLSFASQNDVNLNYFKISEQAPEKINDKTLKTMKKHPSFVVEKPPKDSNENTWFNYGNELFRLDQDSEAIAAFKKAIELNPNFADAYYALGLVYYNQEIIDDNNESLFKAIENFDKAIALNPNFYLLGQAWYKKSLSLDYLEQYDEALNAIDESIKLTDDDAKLYRQRGSILDSLQRYADAYKAYTKSIEIYPLGVTYMLRGHLSMTYENNQPEAAIKDFTKAIELGMINGYPMRSIVHVSLGNYQLALTDINKVIELVPTNPDYYLLRGNVHSVNNNKSQAIADFNKTIELNPNKVDAYILRGNAYAVMQNYEQAIADFKKAIELEPNNDETYAQRSRFYYFNGEYKLAIEDMNQAIKLKPNDVNYYRQRARLKSQFGDAQGALEDYNQAIKLKPNYALLYHKRGELYQVNLLDDTKAMADFDKAIELNSKFGIAYLVRGLLKQKLGDLSAALEDYNQAITLINDPAPDIKNLWMGYTSEFLGSVDNQWVFNKNFSPINIDSFYATAYLRRGNLRLQLKDGEGALKDYNEAIKIAPEDADIYIGRGDYYTQIQQPKKAEADYNKAIKIYSEAIKNKPKNTLNYSSRAAVYSKIKNYEAAITDYSTAIELNAPNSHLWYQGRASLYQKVKDYEAAIKDYSKAIELQPKSIEGYVGRGLLYFEMKDKEAAIKDFSQVIELNKKIANSNYFVAHLIRGSLYQQLKNYSGAVDDYSSFIELLPENHQGYLYRCAVYGDKKEYNQAINDCNQAVKLAPDNLAVYQTRANIYRLSNNYTAAMKDANKMIEISSDKPEGYYVRGVIYLAQNNQTKALEEYQLSLSKNEQFSSAIASSGFIKYEQGETQKAIELWQKAINIKDDLAPIKLALAAAFYKQGQQEKAVSLAKEALNMDRRLEDISYLQDSLWGEQLIKDTKPLLNEVN